MMELCVEPPIRGGAKQMPIAQPMWPPTVANASLPYDSSLAANGGQPYGQSRGNALQEDISKLFELQNAMQESQTFFEEKQERLLVLIGQQHQELIGLMKNGTAAAYAEPAKTSLYMNATDTLQVQAAAPPAAEQKKATAAPPGKATSPSEDKGQQQEQRKGSVVVAYVDGNIDWKSMPTHWPTADDYAALQQDDTSTFFKIKRVVTSNKFEAASGVVIIVNLICMILQEQLRESHSEFMLGVRSDDTIWPTAEKNFASLEYVFCIIYLAELFLRSVFVGRAYLCDILGMLDVVVVVVQTLETFIFPLVTYEASGNGVGILRLMRLSRLLRFSKAIRFAANFAELRVLINTLASSLKSLIWSIVLIASVIIAGGVLMSQLTRDFIESEDHAMSDRTWAYENYGSALKSFYTMFEATFTASWVGQSRRLMTSVGNGFAMFWIIWTVCVNFAVMRVVAALFLKQTMAVASDDAVRVSAMKIKKKEMVAAQLREIFEMADESGDGQIDEKEFVGMVEKPEIASIFVKLELELFEIIVLFRILSDEDGSADYDEFLSGAMKLKDSARTIDTIQILHETAKIQRNLEKISNKVDGLHM